MMLDTFELNILIIVQVVFIQSNKNSRKQKLCVPIICQSFLLIWIDFTYY